MRTLDVERRWEVAVKYQVLSGLLIWMGMGMVVPRGKSYQNQCRDRAAYFHPRFDIGAAQYCGWASWYSGQQGGDGVNRPSM